VNVQFPKLKGIAGTVWILGIASLLTDVSSEMIHSVLPLFLSTTLGASAFTIGFIDGLGETIAACVKLFSGALSDRIGRRKPLILAGYGLSTAVKPLFALAGNPLAALAARCLDRVGKGIRGAPRDALVADVTDPEGRGAAYGLRQSLDSVGAVAGPLVAIVVMTMTAGNFRTVFWLSLIPAVLAVTVLTAGIKEPSSNNTRSDKPPVPLRLQSIKSLGSGFWFVFLVSLLFTLGNSSDAFILLKAKTVGIAMNIVPMCLVVMNVTYSLSAYPAGYLSDKLGRKALLLVSFAIYVGVYAGLAFATTAWQIWILMSFYGLYLGFSQGTLLSIVADRVPKEMRGTAFGLLSLSVGLGLLPASLLAGWLWDTVSHQATFLAGACFATLAFLLFAFDSDERDSTSTEHGGI